MGSKSILGSIFGRDHARHADVCFQRGQLKKAADLYLKAGRYAQAARIFNELGQTPRAVEIYTDHGMNIEAGELLVSHGDHRQASNLFEAAGAFRQAAEASLKAQQVARAGRLFEKAEIYSRAAECFLKVNDVERALGVWSRESERLKERRTERQDHSLERKIAQIDHRRAEMLQRYGRYGEAAELMGQLGRHDEAAELYARAGSHATAAAAYLRANRPELAMASIELSANAPPELRAMIYRRVGREREAGELLLESGNLEEAADAFEAAEDWVRAAAVWERLEDYPRAIELFSRVGRYEEAGRCYAQAGRHRRAAETFVEGGHYRMAADAFLAAGDPLSAADHYRKAGTEEDAISTLEGVQPSDEAYRKACHLLIPLLLETGRTDEVRERLAALPRSSAEGLYWRGRLEEKLENLETALEAYRQLAARASQHRDVAVRLARISQQIEESSGPLRQTVEVPAMSAKVSTAPETPLGRITDEQPAADSSGRPYIVEETLPPWWQGLIVERVTDRRHGHSGLVARFPRELLGDDERTYRRHLSTLSQFEQPTILRLQEAIFMEREVLLLHEPFAGRTLAARLDKGGLEPVAALNLLVQVSDALTQAHKMGIIHGWLSPATILVDNAARAKVVGFALADTFRDDTATEAYRSPEAQEATAGPAGDLFSLGLLGAELLKAFLPADWAHQEKLSPDKVTWPEEVGNLAPKSVLAALVRCLSRSPLERPSAEALKAELSGIGLVPGQVLAQRYEIADELGRGGMSRVYRARDRDLDEEVAIKTVLSPALGRSGEEERLLREVQICRKITHPNVVRVHDFGRFPGGIFVIMELLDGPGLDHVIRDKAPMELAEAKDLLRQIASALYEAHRLKIVHRDLKPGNVILDAGRAKVMDFGIAYMSDSTTQLTRTGQVVGSPMYMAPEQIQGLPLDGTCDLYALGVIAYMMLAGREPFRGKTTTSVVLKHLHEKPPQIREFRPDTPEPWVDMIGRLLAKQPKERYPDAMQLLRAIEQLPE